MSSEAALRVLVIGAGGREHALAWKVAQSPRLEKLFIAPGNPGTANVGQNAALNVNDQAGVLEFCRAEEIDLVIIGPEAPLAAGLSDVLGVGGIKVFGPSQTAAQIESSKVFAKEFMQRRGIPSARFASFDDCDQAETYLRSAAYPVVIKASGLAAGKGVILPETLEEGLQALHGMMLDGAFGAAGEQVVIEERLSGPEVSLLAFTDGRTVKAMLPAQDHKRLLDGDCGPNTGGMGAYAPAPICPPELAEEIVRTAIQPAVDGLRAEGIPYVGVLYAGMMLTAEGPRVLEFNCRFGDPETQALMPLLQSDLLEIALACVEGRLDQLDVHWKSGSAACVVLAAPGYPESPRTGQAIHGLDDSSPDSVAFHAGTRRESSGGEILTAGGRVLGITGWADDLNGALQRAYDAIRGIKFEGMQYRYDIGKKGLTPPLTSLPLSPLPLAGEGKPRITYADSGVNIDAGNRAVQMMKSTVRSTYNDRVLAGIGSFGGLFDVSFLKEFRQPVLVSSIDGVGTKVKLAAQVGSYEGIGRDIVNHCIDDILVQGARPLFFLDYFATAKLEPEVTAEIVSGMAAACQEAGAVLIGGETAEMPGVYVENAFDVAGCIVGVLERGRALPRPDLQAGDVLIGLRSSGLHTNGYSLARRVFEGADLDAAQPDLGVSLAEALLAPHRSYLPLLWPLLDRDNSPVKALTHLTGGGFIENIPRVLPEGLAAIVNAGSWSVPPIFTLIERTGGIAREEMLRVFNMGVGMVAVVSPPDVLNFLNDLGEEAWVVGELQPGEKKVVLR